LQYSDIQALLVLNFLLHLLQSVIVRSGFPTLFGHVTDSAISELVTA